MAASSPTDVWAVGFIGHSTGGDTTLVKHWDGASWTRVLSPSPGAPFRTSVSADSATDAWAVGYVDRPARSSC
jgi:hypothetical protein